MNGKVRESTTRPQLAILLGLILLAAGVRGYRVSPHPLTFDEAFSWRVASECPAELLRGTRADMHPPGHFLLLKAWTAIAGDSPAALRWLSIICSLLLVPAVYILVAEALAADTARGAPEGDPHVEKAPDGAQGDHPAAHAKQHAVNRSALLSAALVAMHAGQVVPARLARSYSLAALMAAVTAWLLLKSLRAQRRPWLWWSAYGAAAVVFMFCHHYALFTLIGQGLFLAGTTLVNVRRSPLRIHRSSSLRVFGLATGIVLTAALVLAVYRPWFPSVPDQMTRVREAFPDRNMSWDLAQASFMEWLTGLEYLFPPERAVWTMMALAVIVSTVWRWDRAGWFFMAQAAVPWLLALCVSFRGEWFFWQMANLGPAQVSLFALWGVFCYRLRWPLDRTLFACLALSYAAYGSFLRLEAVEKRPASIVRGLAWLADRHEQGDMLLVSSPRELNSVLYYMKRAGLEKLPVGCPAIFYPPETTAGLWAAHDKIPWEGGRAPPRIQRVWTAYLGRSPGDEWQEKLTKTFDGPQSGSRYNFSLVLYERR